MWKSSPPSATSSIARAQQERSEAASGGERTCGYLPLDAEPGEGRAAGRAVDVTCARGGQVVPIFLETFKKKSKRKKKKKKVQAHAATGFADDADARAPPLRTELIMPTGALPYCACLCGLAHWSRRDIAVTSAA